MTSFTGRLIFLVQVSRPIVWPVLPLVYLFGLRAAHAEMTIAAMVQLASLTLPMNLIGCGLNDMFDYESDRRSPRRRAIWGATVGAGERALVWRAALAMMPVVVLAAAATRNRDNLVATVCLVLVAWLYSVPPARFKERPPLDSLSNGLGYFLLPLAMGFSLGADPRNMPLRYYLLALCVCGVHALASAADYDADQAAGQITLATRFGRRTAAAFACATFVVAWLLGDFHGTAVRGYLIVCAAATFVSTMFPHDRTITVACVTIFVGFLVAGTLHVCSE